MIGRETRQARGGFGRPRFPSFACSPTYAHIHTSYSILSTSTQGTLCYTGKYCANVVFPLNYLGLFPTLYECLAACAANFANQYCDYSVVNNGACFGGPTCGTLVDDGSYDDYVVNGVRLGLLAWVWWLPPKRRRPAYCDFLTLSFFPPYVFFLAGNLPLIRFEKRQY